MNKQLFLRSLLLIVSVFIENSNVVAADNTSANDLQQLQALQQISQAPPIRQNLQLNGNNQTTTDNNANVARALTNNAAGIAPSLPPPSGTNNLPPNPSDPAAGAVNFPATGQTPPQFQGGGNFSNQSASFGQQATVAVQGGPQMSAFQAPFTPPGNPTGDSDISQSAFNSMVNTALPMTPDQIHRLKQLFTATQYAQAAPPGIPPRPVATSQIVNLAPGATPPVIRLAQGFVTSLVFIDSTGAPWPIDSYSIGDPQRFNIQWNKTDNTLMIQALSLYNYGNLAVRLKGLVTPVMLTLIPGQKDIDYRVDLRIQGLGPNAVPCVRRVFAWFSKSIVIGCFRWYPSAR